MVGMDEDLWQTQTCGCCDRANRRMTELASTPGTYICWSCALWALRRVRRPAFSN